MLLGFHHITALAGDPQGNLDFYTQFLGLRLVKRTVNFDDPGTYHFYFGDRTGTPGTVLTFFPWPTAFHGRRGSGQAVAVGFSVPRNCLPHWIARCQAANIAVTQETRFGEDLIAFQDPDGMPLELIANAPETDVAGLGGLHSTAIREANLESTAALLSETLGFRQTAEGSGRTRFELNGAIVDILHTPGASRGMMGAGMIHHLAFRVANDDQQLRWREKLLAAGFRASAVRDRQYFHSIYFREPGGVLFEIATDGPGFLTDESENALGQALKLPPWLEPIRESVERRLPPVTSSQDISESPWPTATR